MMLDSLQYAKEHKKEFLNRILKNQKLPRRKAAIFMAGAPGAGKTEMASMLARTFGPTFVKIDADSFREYFPGYNGKNSSDFQRGASYLVDIAFSKVVHAGYSFILDGTFSHVRAEQNIERVLKRNYHTKVYFVYQEAVDAWHFTKIREKAEGRVIPKSAFIKSFIRSRENVKSIQSRHGNQVIVNVAFKDYQQTITDFAMNVKSIDDVLPKAIAKEELEEMLDDRL